MTNKKKQEGKALAIIALKGLLIITGLTIAIWWVFIKDNTQTQLRNERYEYSNKARSKE